MSKRVLIVYCKAPVHNQVKTRLAASIGNDKALEVYHHLLTNSLQVAEQGNWLVQLHWGNFIPSENFDHYDNHLQQGKNLGERMSNSLNNALSNNEKAVLVGTDCPNLSTEIIEAAFEKLSESDVVFGPANDGGYYLVGLSKTSREIFQLESWSHKQVLNQSLSLARRAQLSTAVVKSLTDVDTFADLKKFPELLNRFDLTSL